MTFLYVLSWELADNLWHVYVDIQVILRCGFPDRSEAEVNDCCFRGHSGWARCPFLNCWGSNLVMWLMFGPLHLLQCFDVYFSWFLVFGLFLCWSIFHSLGCLTLLCAAILSVLLVLWSQLSLTIKLMLLKFLPYDDYQNQNIIVNF